MKDQVLLPNIEVREKGLLQVAIFILFIGKDLAIQMAKEYLLFTEVQEEEVNQDIEGTLIQINSILFNLTKEVAVHLLLSPN